MINESSQEGQSEEFIVMCSWCNTEQSRRTVGPGQGDVSHTKCSNCRADEKAKLAEMRAAMEKNK